MKNRNLIFYCILFIIGCTENTSSDKIKKEEKGKIEFENYYVYLDSIWVVDKNENIEEFLVVYFDPKMENNTNEGNIVFSCDKVNRDVEPKEGLDFIQSVLEKKFINSKFYESIEMKNHNGVYYTFLAEVQHDKDTEPLKAKYHYYFRKNKVYTITFSAPVDDFDKCLSEMEETFDSFTIK